MADDKDYSAASKIVIARKEREIEKAKDMADAFKKALHAHHREMLSDADVKKSVSQEMMNGVKGGSPLSGILAKLKGAKTNAAEGMNSPDLEEFGNADNTPTGLDDRYWEND
jgi:hypothetical protein